MSRVHTDSAGISRVLGGCRLPAMHAAAHGLKLGRYLDVAQLPASPESCDWSGPALSVIRDVEGNDLYGDCVLAEEAHFVGLATGNTGRLFAYTRAQTLAAYSAITGFDPSNPASDQGTDPVAALNYFVANPYADGTKLSGWALVDMTSKPEAMFALWGLGNLKLWCGLPDAWINPFPSADGFVWDVAPSNVNNGHCFGGCSYGSPAIVGANSDGIQVMTWGKIGTLTWRAAAALCVPAAGGGAAVRVTPDWLARGANATPSGFSWQDLIADFDRFLGGSLPIPPPSPAPAPPTGAATLASAQAAVAAALGGDFPLIERGTAVTQAQAALAGLTWPA